MRSKKYTFKRIAISVFSVSFIISLTSALVLSLPIWRLTKVEITGTDLIFKNKIVDVAKVPFGENIFFINLIDIDKRIRGIIQVKDVKIRKKLPDAVTIEIEERKPFALIVIGGRAALIDDEGYILANQGSLSYYKINDASRLPVIRGIKKNDLVNGMRLNLRNRMFISNIFKLLSSYINPESLQIEIGNYDNIVIFVEDVLRLELGDMSRMNDKIAVFGAILKEIKGKWEKIEYINIKVVDAPVVKYKI